MKTLDELQPSPPEPRLERADPQIEEGRDLEIGETLQISQCNDDGLLFRHLAQGGVHLSQKLAPLGVELGIVSRRRQFERGLVDESGFPLSSCLAIVVDAEIARQPEGPGEQWNVAAVFAQVAKQAQKYILRQILGLLTSAREVEARLKILPP